MLNMMRECVATRCVVCDGARCVSAARSGVYDVRALWSSENGSTTLRIYIAAQQRSNGLRAACKVRSEVN